jgi:hypothetical protein
MDAMETFVVRLWTPDLPTDAAANRIRGVVEHVGSGRSAAFAGEAELVAFLSGDRDATTKRGGTRQVAAVARFDGGNRGDVEVAAAAAPAEPGRGLVLEEPLARHEEAGA